MTRSRILVILLSSLMVLSSCSRKYGHLTRRVKGTPVIVQKSERESVRHRSNDEKKANEIIVMEELPASDVMIDENNDPFIVQPNEKNDPENVKSTLSEENISQFAKKIQSNNELIPDGNLKNISVKGPIGTARQVNKLRKEVKSKMGTPGTEDDFGGLLYIVLIVILVLLILSLLTEIFGGWLVRLVMLALLIILILYLLNR